jgi:hypothetical protein
MRTQLWVYHRHLVPRLPDSFGFGECVPVRPADNDGWSGYWWAENPIEAGSGENELVLIRRGNVARAKRGDRVNLYVPGLWGTPYITVFSDWMPRRGRGYFALYEGDVVPGYYIDSEWQLFRPHRQLEILTVREFRKRLAAFEAEQV